LVALELVWPFSLVTLSPPVVLGAYFLADGLLALLAGTTVRGLRTARRPYLAEGLVGGTAGVVTLALAAAWTPILPWEAYYTMLGAWAALTGLLEIAAAFSLRLEVASLTLVAFGALGGLVRLVYGVPTAATAAVYVNPLATAGVARVQPLLLAAFALAFCALQLALANALRQWPKSEYDPATSRAPF
jgi:uncharacterized membrane protein HdeD (DUF308 family)